MKRFGAPAEIVGPALFLACDASSMVTGHVLAVDGGYLAQ
jgi:NAD(P)-dependent dehydrogenase (short-subunit alcohol dehydrogenase family)